MHAPVPRSGPPRAGMQPSPIVTPSEAATRGAPRHQPMVAELGDGSEVFSLPSVSYGSARFADSTPSLPRSRQVARPQHASASRGGVPSRAPGLLPSASRNESRVSVRGGMLAPSLSSSALASGPRTRPRRTTGGHPLSGPAGSSLRKTVKSQSKRSRPAMRDTQLTAGGGKQRAKSGLSITPFGEGLNEDDYDYAPDEKYRTRLVAAGLVKPRASEVRLAAAEEVGEEDELEAMLREITSGSNTDRLRVALAESRKAASMEAMLIRRGAMEVLGTEYSAMEAATNPRQLPAIQPPEEPPSPRVLDSTLTYHGLQPRDFARVEPGQLGQIMPAEVRHTAKAAITATARHGDVSAKKQLEDLEKEMRNIPGLASWAESLQTSKPSSPISSHTASHHSSPARSSPERDPASPPRDRSKMKHAEAMQSLRDRLSRIAGVELG
jgi:hypothetical protein